MYSVRILEENDYIELQQWWAFWRFPAPPQDCLPNNGTGGIMLSKDGIDIVAGFIYFTNSKLAWLEYIVSNPNYKEPDRKELICSLIEEIGFVAKSKGYRAIFTSVKNENLVKRYEECGYVKGSNNTYEMILSL